MRHTRKTALNVRPPCYTNSIKKVDKGYQQRKENKMFSLKYKMSRVGRYGNLETVTTKVKLPSEVVINNWLDSAVSDGWTILEVEVI